MSEETIAKRVINRRRGITPQKFIFILDRSGSMTGQRFYALTNYLRTHIESNGIESISSIFLFNDRTRLFYPTETVNQNNLIQELDIVRTNGATRLFGTIGEVLQNIPEDSENVTVVVISDGVDTVNDRIRDPSVFNEARNQVLNSIDRNHNLYFAGLENINNNSQFFGNVTQLALDMGFPEGNVLSVNYENQESQNIAMTSLRRATTGGDSFTQDERFSASLSYNDNDFFEGPELQSILAAPLVRQQPSPFPNVGAENDLEGGGNINFENDNTSLFNNPPRTPEDSGITPDIPGAPIANRNRYRRQINRGRAMRLNFEVSSDKDSSKRKREK